MEVCKTLKTQLPNSPLGTWIISKIEDRNLLLSEVAERAKISRVALHYILKGQRTPTDGTIARICKVLGVTVQDAKAFYTLRKAGRPKGVRNGKKTNGERLEQPSDVAPQADR